MRILLILTCIVVNVGYSNPPPTPNPPCSGLEMDYFAIVRRIDRYAVGGCTNVTPDVNQSLGFYTAMLGFENTTDGVFFQTKLDINTLFPITNIVSSGNVNLLPAENKTNSGYIHFMEISKANSFPELPDPKGTILDAIISYVPNDLDGGIYNLVINYNTSNLADSIIIPLEEKIVNITIEWINSTCSYGLMTCGHDLGQIEIRLDYINSTYINVIENLDFHDYSYSSKNITTNDSPLWKAGAAYWGELDNVNMNHNIILSIPD